MKKIFIFFIIVFALFQPAVAEESAFTGMSSAVSKSLFLSLESMPQKVYVGQVFAVKFKAIAAQKNIDGLANTFSGASDVVVLNPQNTWESAGSNIYYNTFYFKITSKNATMPRLSVSIVQNKEALESELITLSVPTIIQLKKEPYFSNVIAQTLEINKYKTTSFDAKNVIIVLEIEATGANLHDFALNEYAKSGIDSFSEDNATQKIFYYAIFPNYQKNFDFSYFDLPTNKFHKISLPITIENEEVSTQLGLNPKESIFEFYKSVGYGVFAFIFFVFLLRKRRWYYLVLSLIFLALLFLDQNPLNNVQLKSNSILMILPTERSTVFFTSDKQLPVEKLAEYNNYIKILLPDGKIGWTQRENIIKN